MTNQLLLWLAGLTVEQQAWTSVGIGSAIYYATFGTFVWPQHFCWWCFGHGCSTCGETGKLTNYSRRAVDALVRKAGGS